MTALTIGLVGNPNCGKTTLFNALTGARQQVGNWPGVTVERKTGTYRGAKSEVRIIDLPGVYSLAVTSVSSLDERIAREFVLSGKADLIVNISTPPTWSGTSISPRSSWRCEYPWLSR